MTLDPCSLDSHKLLSFEQAVQHIHATLNPIHHTESVPLKAALGRVLAVAAISPHNLPTERNSAMDGYAFCSTDLMPTAPCTLLQIGTSWAGKPYPIPIKTGECVRIFTGAVIPEGADSVIMQEQVQVNGLFVTLPGTTKPFQNIREAGEDVAIGDTLLPAGRKITATDLGLLAAAGLNEVSVVRPLKIAYFSTGDELVSIGTPLASGQLYDSNRYTLYGLLNDPCYHATDLGVVRDDLVLLEKLLQDNADLYDVIISTGGASVGDADHVQSVLARCGEIKVWKIAIKPGKPLAFGTIGNCYFFGLPGNPVAVITTFQQIVTPALQRLCTATPTPIWRFQATSLQTIKKSPGRLDFQRGILTQSPSGDFEVQSVSGQGSHQLGAFSRANCYIILSEDCVGIAAGERVTVEPF